MDLQTVFNHIDTALHIETAGFEIIRLIPDGQLNLIGNVFDISLRVMVDGRIYRTAERMSKHYDKRASQMIRRILNASQLMVIDHISRHTNHKEISQACRKILSGITRESEQVMMIA